MAGPSPPKPPEVPKLKHSNTPYIMAIVALVVSAFICIIAVTFIRPEQDNMPLFVLIVGLLTSITVSFLSFIKGNEAVQITHDTQKTAVETHAMVNSRLSEFIETARALALAQGRLEGIKTGTKQEAARAGQVVDARAEGVEEGATQGRIEGIVTGTEQATHKAEALAQIIKDANAVAQDKRE